MQVDTWTDIACLEAKSSLGNKNYFGPKFIPIDCQLCVDCGICPLWPDALRSKCFCLLVRCNHWIVSCDPKAYDSFQDTQGTVNIGWIFGLFLNCTRGKCWVNNGPVWWWLFLLTSRLVVLLRVRSYLAGCNVLHWSCQSSVWEMCTVWWYIPHLHLLIVALHDLHW